MTWMSRCVSLRCEVSMTMFLCASMMVFSSAAVKSDFSALTVLNQVSMVQGSMNSAPAVRLRKCSLIQTSCSSLGVRP